MAGPTFVKATAKARSTVSAMPMGPEGPGFSDNFESYPAGPLVPQGGWLYWNGVGGPLPGSQNATIAQAGGACYPDCDGSGGLSVADFGCFQTKFVQGDMYADCDGSTTLTVADFSCFQTKFVQGCAAGNKYADSVVETDVVQLFNITPTTNPSGKWRLSADTYVPSTQVGDGWFIALNTFVHPYVAGGNWSVQVRFNTTTVISDFGAQTTPSIVDQWVPIVCDIDLLADTLNISYGGTQFVFNAIYSQNVSGLGTTNLQCIDLYSTAAGFKWDNVSLQPMP
jgi:hypothetical protein